MKFVRQQCNADSGHAVARASIYDSNEFTHRYKPHIQFVHNTQQSTIASPWRCSIDRFIAPLLEEGVSLLIAFLGESILEQHGPAGMFHDERQQ
jgi:hypothetical protein